MNKQSVILLLIWYIFGCWSFIHWWRKKCNFKTNDIWVMLIAGISGPMSFIFGWIIHGEKSNKKYTIILKRKN